MTKITKILTLFFAFNESKDSGSIFYEHNEYDDKFFRWSNDTFDHEEKLCCVFNNKSIKLFSRIKVYDRIQANKEKIKWNPDRTLFGCNPTVVEDLVHIIEIEDLTDAEIKQMEAHKNAIKDDKGKLPFNKK